MTPHPELVDPPWFQDLAKRAFGRELDRLVLTGVPIDDAWEQAMWYLFALRSNLAALYAAGKAPKGST